MKSKFKICLFVLLMCPFIISAAQVSLSCPGSVKNGETVTCAIKVSSGSVVVSGFQASISADSGLIYKSYSVTSGWAGNSSSSNFLVYGNKVSGDKTLGKYVYTANGSANQTFTVSLKNINVSDENGNPVSSNSTASATVRIKCNDNSLKNLTINGTSVSGFNPGTLNYSYQTESSSINIGATSNSSKASISGAGNKGVEYGSNTFNIVVTAENGEKKTYKITVTRPDNREGINTLNSLSVEGYTISPSFNKVTLNYSLNVEANVSKIRVNASKTSSKSSFVSGFGVRDVTLNYGQNKVYVKVKAENGKVNTYTITVNRKDDRSTNNNLKSLTASAGNIKFNSKTTSYSILTDKNEITISGEVEDSKSQIQGAKTYQLNEGINEIKINVKAENGDIKTYIIKVTKVKDFSELNISNDLKELTVLKKYDLNFNKDTLEYNLTIGDEESLELDLELEDENSSYEIIGNENLKDGSVISIVVTSVDGKEKEYKINIKKNDVNTVQKEKKVSLPLILLIISGIVNVILIVLFILKRNKSDKVKEIVNETAISEEKKDNE